MMEGKTLKVRRNITEKECDGVGVPLAGVAGALCYVNNVSPKGCGYRDIGGDCAAYHVTLMSGTHEGAQWWLPPSFFKKECMFRA